MTNSQSSSMSGSSSRYGNCSVRWSCRVRGAWAMFIIASIFLSDCSTRAARLGRCSSLKWSPQSRLISSMRANSVSPVWSAFSGASGLNSGAASGSLACCSFNSRNGFSCNSAWSFSCSAMIGICRISIDWIIFGAMTCPSFIWGDISNPHPHPAHLGPPTRVLCPAA